MCVAYMKNVDVRFLEATNAEHKCGIRNGREEHYRLPVAVEWSVSPVSSPAASQQALAKEGNFAVTIIPGGDGTVGGAGVIDGGTITCAGAWGAGSFVEGHSGEGGGGGVPVPTGAALSVAPVSAPAAS